MTGTDGQDQIMEQPHYTDLSTALINMFNTLET